MTIPGRLNIALTLGAGAACCLLLRAASHGPPWQIALAAITFSFVNNTMFSLMHDSVHGIAHENRRVNEWLGRVAAVFFPTSFSIQRVFHLGHHARNRTVEEQFDYLRPFDRPLLKRAQWYAILTGVYWIFVPSGAIVFAIWPRIFEQPWLTSRSSDIARQTGGSSILGGVQEAPVGRIRWEVLFALAVQTVMWRALDLNAIGWLACYAAFAINWSSLQYADHAFSPLDVRNGAWNLRVNPLTRMLFLNYHHHLAHHQNPHVPWLHLGQFVDTSAERPWFWRIYLEMWRGPRALPSDTCRQAAGEPAGWQPAIRPKQGTAGSLPAGPPAASRPVPFISWPGKTLKETVPLYTIFGLLFAICYGGASWLSTRYASLPAWNFAFETRVPFIPWFAIVYLTIVPALLLAPFVFRSRTDILPLTTTLCVETIAASVFFLAFPQTTAFQRPPTTNPFFHIADTINLTSNQFPSLHVAFACTVAWAYSARCSMLGRAFWTIWALIVTASAWLIWEHHFVDLIGGAVLAAIGIRLVYPVEWWVELRCLEQCARFSMRHIRYFVIFAVIWGRSLGRWRERRVVRVAFCTLQWIDDLLDGDRACTREPLDIADALLDDMTRRTFSGEPLSRLTKALFEDLDEEAQQTFIALVREMRRDRERVLQHAVWSAPEIDEHLRRTFELSVDVMLSVTGCRARAADVAPLIEVLAWCSTFRDLDEDLRKGLINIPREVADVQQWARERHASALVTLNASSQSIARLDDPAARKILGVFQKSIERFARRAPRHPERGGRGGVSEGSQSTQLEILRRLRGSG